MTLSMKRACSHPPTPQAQPRTFLFVSLGSHLALFNPTSLPCLLFSIRALASRWGKGGTGRRGGGKKRATGLEPCQIFSSAVLQSVPFGDVRACSRVVRAQLQQQAAENRQNSPHLGPSLAPTASLLSSLHALPPPTHFIPDYFHRISHQLRNSDLDFHTHKAPGELGRGGG